MDNVKYSFNNLDVTILSRNHRHFIMDKDVIRLFNLNEYGLEFLLRELQEKREMISHFYEKENETTYFDLTFMFLMGLELDENWVKDFYIFCKKNDLLSEISPFYIGEIEGLFIRSIFEYVADEYEELMSPMKKINGSDDDLHPLCINEYFEENTIKKLIEQVKKQYHLSENFGKEQQKDALAYTIYVMYHDKTTIDNFIEEEASRFFYYFLKEKPFIEGNEEIACLVVLYHLNLNRILFDNNKITVRPTDFAYALSLVENSSLPKEEVIQKLKYLFAQGTYENHQLARLLDLVKKDNTYENVINYVVAFIENYVGYQGYYEFYKGKSRVYKIHYHGEYRYFKLNIAQTMSSENTLCFDVLATAFMEAPYDLLEREEVMKELYDEIQYRSYQDVLVEDLEKGLSRRLSPYFDFSQIHLCFNIKWKFEVDLDDGF